MLKPKKEIFRKEIKQDAFLNTIDKIEANIENNSSDYIKIFGGLILFVIIISFLINSRNLNKEILSTSLGNALVSLNKGDYENAKFQFETILSDHSGTRGIELAQYYLGKIEYDQGDNLTSREYLESFIKSGYSVDILKSSSVIMLSDILAKSNEIQKAVKIIEDGLELVDDEYLKNELKIEKAKLLIESQRIDEGSLILRDIYTKENISSGLKSRIEEIQGGNGV